jgi:hypothetical protein
MRFMMAPEFSCPLQMFQSAGSRLLLRAATSRFSEKFQRIGKKRILFAARARDPGLIVRARAATMERS